MARHFRKADNTFAGTWVDGLPDDGTLVEVDAAPTDGRMIWNGSAWGWPAATKAELKAAAADKRYRVETAGITALGAPIKTDRESQAMISGARAWSQQSGQNIKWKLASGGFTQVTPAQIEQIALAVGSHVQACFAAESNINSEIDLGNVTTAEQIESWQGWPS